MNKGSDGKEVRDDKNRLQQLREAGMEPVFSPTLGAEHLLDAIAELGWAASTGFGLQPLSWAEIAAYAEVTSAIDEPYEFRALRGMSAAYCEGIRRGELWYVKAPPSHEDENADGL